MNEIIGPWISREAFTPESTKPNKISCEIKISFSSLSAVTFLYKGKATTGPFIKFEGEEGGW